MRRRYDLAGAATAAALLVFAAVTWNYANRYRETFFMKRAAAGLRYDDNVIGYLKHGHAIAIVLVLVVVLAVAVRVVTGRRRRGPRSP